MKDHRPLLLIHLRRWASSTLANNNLCIALVHDAPHCHPTTRRWSISVLCSNTLVVCTRFVYLFVGLSLRTPKINHQRKASCAMRWWGLAAKVASLSRWQLNNGPIITTKCTQSYRIVLILFLLLQIEVVISDLFAKISSPTNCKGQRNYTLIT